MLFKTLKPKVFCIGHNKTGTTAIDSVLTGFGYRMRNMAKEELMFFDWYTYDFKEIIKFFKTIDAFQDILITLHFTYQYLDSYFKDAKFILTIRSIKSGIIYLDILQFYHNIIGILKGRNLIQH